MAATTVNVRCGLVKFHKEYSEISHVGPSSLAIGRKFNDRGETLSCSTNNNMMVLPKKKGFEERGESLVHEKMDEWMKESVVEIVKNLREAPLLVHVYNNGGELRTEKGVEEECWVEAMEKWKRKEMVMPEGVIFVEKLEDDNGDDDGVSRAWGIVVQGRGCECSPLCYLLKTSRGGGDGFCCTHFCLMRVKSFRESARSQLQNCWLN